MKKKLTALALVVVMVAMLFTGLTMAYFTDTADVTNTFTVGNVEIDLKESPIVNGEKDPNANFPDEWEDGTDGNEYEVNAVPGVEYDKDPTVKNTGTNGAYLRATVCLNPGVNLLASGLEFKDMLQNLSSDWTLVDEGAAMGAGDIDHLNQHGSCWYLMFEYNGVLESQKTSVIFDGFKLPENMTNEQAALLGNSKVPFEVVVTVEAIQADGLSQAEAMAILDNNGEAVEAKAVSTKEELEEALAADQETINVVLTNDVTYDVAAWAANGMGGASAKTIIIDGDGHTLTFNQTNSDWNNIVTNNGATLVLKDMHLTNAGHNDGPWNRHDLNFACEVEMENVTSDKAFAFKAGASLKNVAIDDANTSDTYAIWIQPNGQTVTLDGCTIDMEDAIDGRGIKIDEQYLAADEVGKVTLVVKNTKFVTEEKAAILVKSVAGADIALENVDISGVKTDTTNAVWVDSASAAYYDLVSVTGGTKIQEQ